MPFDDVRPVRSLACVDVDGRAMAVTGDASGTVRLWDLVARRRVGEPMAGHTGGVIATACGILGGCPVAVTASEDGTLRLWDLRARREAGPAFAGAPQGIAALACLEVAGRVVAVSGDADGAVRVWDLATRRQVGGPLTGHAGPVAEVACIDVEGRPAAVTRGAEDGTVRVWDVAHRRAVGVPLTADSGTPTALACTRVHGRAVAVASTSAGKLLQWDLRTLRPAPALVCGYPGQAVSTIACLDIEGQTVAVTAGGIYSDVCYWDLRTRWRVDPPLIGDSTQAALVVCTMVQHAPVAVTVGQDGAIRLRDLASRPPFNPAWRSYQPWEAAWASVKAGHDLDGRGVVIIHSGRGDDVSVWDAAAGQRLGVLPSTGMTTCTCASLGGRAVVVMVGDISDVRVRVFDIATREQILRIENPVDDDIDDELDNDEYDDEVRRRLWENPDYGLEFGGNITGSVACIESDGRLLAVTACEEHEGVDKPYNVWVWDLTSGRRVAGPLHGHPGEIECLAATTVDGRPVAISTGGNDATARVWDLRTYQEIGEPLRHTGYVRGVACTELDGLPVAVTSGFDGLRMWDLTTHAPMGEPMGGDADSFDVLVCTRLDGRPIAVVTSQPLAAVAFWDLATRTLLDTVRLPAPVTSIAAVNDTIIVGFEEDVLALRPAQTGTAAIG